MRNPRFVFSDEQVQCIVSRINAGVISSHHITTESFREWAESPEAQQMAADSGEFIWFNTTHIIDGTCQDMENFSDFTSVIYIGRDEFSDQQNFITSSAHVQ